LESPVSNDPIEVALLAPFPAAENQRRRDAVACFKPPGIWGPVYNRMPVETFLDPSMDLDALLARADQHRSRGYALRIAGVESVSDAGGTDYIHDIFCLEDVCVPETGTQAYLVVKKLFDLELEARLRRMSDEKRNTLRLSRSPDMLRDYRFYAAYTGHGVSVKDDLLPGDSLLAALEELQTLHVGIFFDAIAALMDDLRE
jgi:hypothetical protein